MEREEISQYQSDTKCEKCNGYRLKDEALCVKIDNLNISQVTEKSIIEAKEWFFSLRRKTRFYKIENRTTYFKRNKRKIKLSFKCRFGLFNAI